MVLSLFMKMVVVLKLALLLKKRLMQELLPLLAKQTGRPVEATPELARLADLLRERSRTLGEMAERAAFYPLYDHT